MGIYNIDTWKKYMLTSRKKIQELNNKQLKSWNKENGEAIHINLKK